LLIEPLTRHRIFWSRLLGIVVVACVLLGYPPRILAPWILDMGELMGLVLLTAAAFGRIWCLVFIAGKKNDILVTDGPYSITRNPLYVFSFLGAIGFGLAVENPLLAGLLAVLFGIYYPYVVRKEEGLLASVFGATFQEYAARTPCWFPNLSLYKEPTTITVSPVKIREGILDAMWFIWAAFFWEILEEFHIMEMF